jgi:hypothetical protein
MLGLCTAQVMGFSFPYVFHMIAAIFKKTKKSIAVIKF